MVAVTAAAAVWASHSQLSRTTIQYASHSQPLQRQHTLRVPLLISAPLLVRRSLVIDGRAMGWLVPAHTPPRCVLGPSRFLQVTGGFVLSKWCKRMDWLTVRPPPPRRLPCAIAGG